MKGKVFTDGDFVARARNRQEDRCLSVRLKHLDQEQDLAHSNIEKERQTLLASRRSTQSTSGRSPVLGTSFNRFVKSNTTPLISSTHFRKPWALTIAQTSHNAVYNDDFDPFRCRRASLQVFRSSRRNCASAPSGARERSKSLMLPRPLTAYRHTDNSRSVQCVKENPDGSKMRLQSDNTLEEYLLLTSDGRLSKSSSSGSGRRCRPSSVVWNVSEESLPTGNGLAWVEETGLLRETAGVDIHYSTESEQVCTPTQNTIDSADAVDNSSENGDFIIFKGRRIRHYVKPQDRYKHDPFKEVRHEKLVRKLSVENPIFLNSSRETSMNIKTTFPKAARDRALRRMVEQNQIEVAERRKPVSNNVDLQRRIKEFCRT